MCVTCVCVVQREALKAQWEQKDEAVGESSRKVARMDTSA